MNGVAWIREERDGVVDIESNHKIIMSTSIN